MSRRDFIIFISLSFMWSLSFIFYRVGVPEFGSMSFASLRVIFAGITMLIFVMFNPSHLAAARQHWKPFEAVVGLSLYSDTVCFILLCRSSRECWSACGTQCRSADDERLYR